MNYQYNCQVTQNNLASWLRIGDHQNLEQAYKAYLVAKTTLTHFTLWSRFCVWSQTHKQKISKNTDFYEVWSHRKQCSGFE